MFDLGLHCLPIILLGVCNQNGLRVAAFEKGRKQNYLKKILSFKSNPHFETIQLSESLLPDCKSCLPLKNGV